MAICSRGFRCASVFGLVTVAWMGALWSEEGFLQSLNHETEHAGTLQRCQRRSGRQVGVGNQGGNRNVAGGRRSHGRCMGCRCFVDGGGHSGENIDGDGDRDGGRAGYPAHSYPACHRSLSPPPPTLQFHKNALNEWLSPPNGFLCLHLSRPHAHPPQTDVEHQRLWISRTGNNPDYYADLSTSTLPLTSHRLDARRV